MVDTSFSDMLIRIKNAYLARQKTVEIPYSKIKDNLAKILLEEGYISKIEIKKSKSSQKKKAVEVKILKVDLKYESKKPAVEGIKVISKSSIRVYVKKGNIPRILGGRGLVVLSTTKGLMSGHEAQKKGLGGEVVGEVW